MAHKPVKALLSFADDLFCVRPCSLPCEYDYKSIINKNEPYHILNFKLRNIKNTGIRKILDNIHQILNGTIKLELDTIKIQTDRLLMLFPNNLHPKFVETEFVPNFDTPGKIVDSFNVKNVTKESFKFENIMQELCLGKNEHIGNFTGPKSYYFMNQLVSLERALLKFVFAYLKQKQFEFINVPSIIHKSFIERCGFSLNNIRDQIFYINNEQYLNLSLAGTSEIMLGAIFCNHLIPYEQLPKRMFALSRCYRAETTTNKKEHGFYRVNYFDKIEMFAITPGGSGAEHSENMLHEFLGIQKNMFSILGLHAKILEMAPHELGIPAYHKYDIEAWMPGREVYGEISSASNCTDFQARRLGIKYTQNERGKDVVENFCHTINGTACAIPRMLIALLETFYDPDSRSVRLPEVLRPYLREDEMTIQVPSRYSPWSQTPLKSKL